MKKEKTNKVIVAMSGGIDSSVTAALFKNSRFNVVGVFMKFWATPSADGLKGRWNRCCSPEAQKRARKVAQILGIPFYVLNFEKEFKKKVVDYFLREYKKGRTPNPCVVCNKQIKFGLLLEKALGLKADFVATGHYTRLRREIKNKKLKIKNYALLRGKDKTKDQSYFLWQLNQKQLKHILFPVGDYTKKEVRNLARKFKLPVLGVPESQEICFIRDNLNNFLGKHLGQKPGPIVCLNFQIKHSEKVIGQHQGLWFYTIGQRKGIELYTLRVEPGPKGIGLPGGPFYVVKKDFKRNALIVTPFPDDKALFSKKLIAEKVNWLSGKQPKLPLKIKAQIRYGHKAVTATITKKLKSGKIELVFTRPQRAVTPGQSVVFYQGQELLGGGIVLPFFTIVNNSRIRKIGRGRG